MIYTREIIIANKAKCSICGDIIQSLHRHDFRSCSCGEISVDGGHSYLRRTVKTSFSNVVDLSEIREEEYESIV